MAQLSFGPRGSRSKTTRSARTRSEAVAALDEMKAERRIGVVPSKLALGAFLRLWLDESARPSISANTYRGYEDILGHLGPLAEVPLFKVTAEDIEGMCNHMTSRKGHKLVPSAPKTIRNCQIMLRHALDVAVQRGHVAKNVARLVPLRRVPRYQVEALTKERAQAILAAVAGDRYEAAYALALVGARASEITGLAWSDIDRQSAVAVLRYQLVGSGKTATRQELKTAASEAPIPLPPFVMTRLEAHRLLQLKERAAAGTATEDGLVFVTPRGYGVNGSWLAKHFQSLLESAGLPRMRLHDLRHGAASLLVAAGAHPRVAQELLRHASSATTMAVYAHVNAAQQREASEMLERALTGQ